MIDEQTRTQLIEKDPKSADLIRPLAVGDDVRRWHIRDKKRYLIFTRRGIEIEKYPAILAHLDQFRERLEPRPKDWDESERWPGRKAGTYKWYEIQDDIAYFQEFGKPKIIYPDMAQEPRFTLDYSGTFFGNTAYMIAIEDKYLLGVLNSAPFWNLCLQSFAVFKGNTLRIFKQDLESMPIPVATEECRQEIIALVDILLSNPKADRLLLEKTISNLVSKLYGL
ncbi:hypothetical protein Dcar01_01414 [Deinococcus carri]|uniref:site-specific DNA-methyltransferase (adenine-specific) n=1 Tax=Deinococcus carri TaxID=1211323 RepID=A0ABP9W6H5_9DEIO